MNIHRIFNFFGRRFRLKRMQLFINLFEITSSTRILDVGGTHHNWLMIECPAEITLINLSPPSQIPQLPGNIKYLQGDGLCLPFETDAFDIVFSNSVIEHLNNFDNQKLFGKEVKRVGKWHFIQTPAQEFILEPHFLMPFFHFLPKTIQVLLARNFTVWGWLTRPSSIFAENMVNEIRLLSEYEIKKIFSESTLVKERFLFLNKSYILFLN